jgi:hypothetical protein
VLAPIGRVLAASSPCASSLTRLINSDLDPKGLLAIPLSPASNVTFDPKFQVNELFSLPSSGRPQIGKNLVAIGINGELKIFKGTLQPDPSVPTLNIKGVPRLGLNQQMEDGSLFIVVPHGTNAKTGDSQIVVQHVLPAGKWGRQTEIKVDNMSLGKRVRTLKFKGSDGNQYFLLCQGSWIKGRAPLVVFDSSGNQRQLVENDSYIDGEINEISGDIIELPGGKIAVPYKGKTIVMDPLQSGNVNAQQAHGTEFTPVAAQNLWAMADRVGVFRAFDDSGRVSFASDKLKDDTHIGFSRLGDNFVLRFAEEKLKSPRFSFVEFLNLVHLTSTIAGARQMSIPFPVSQPQKIDSSYVKAYPPKELAGGGVIWPVLFAYDASKFSFQNVSQLRSPPSHRLLMLNYFYIEPDQSLDPLPQSINVKVVSVIIPEKDEFALSNLNLVVPIKDNRVLLQFPTEEGNLAVILDSPSLKPVQSIKIQDTIESVVPGGFDSNNERLYILVTSSQKLPTFKLK